MESSVSFHFVTSFPWLDIYLRSRLLLRSSTRSYFASLGFTVTFAIIYLFLIIHHCSYDLRDCLCSDLLSAILVSWDRNIAPFLGLYRLAALQHGFHRSSELDFWYYSKH